MLVPPGRSRPGKLAARWRHNRGVDRDLRIRADRGDVVVCVAAGEQQGNLERCLRSIVRHTPAEVAILICGGSPPAGLAQTIEGSGRTIRLHADIEAGFAAASPADVVLVSSECLVAEQWLDRLRAAAYSDSRVATATALVEPEAHATVAVAEFARAAEELRRRSPVIRPRVHAVTGQCVYIRRMALELVGDFDSAEEFSRRGLQTGLAHIVADDVLVLCLGSDLLSADRDDVRNDGATGPLSRVLAVARGVFNGLSVAIDARVLDGPPGGTRLHTLELIAALARTGEHRVTAIVTPSLDAATRELIEGLPGIRLTTPTNAGRGARADLVHRPRQVSAPADLAFLARVADRLVISQQDLIGYHNPAYFPSVEAWHGYRELTRRSLAAADRVLFFSAHARDEALAAELVETHRASVVQIGVDHRLTSSSHVRASRPDGVDRLPADAEMLLCLGTDLRHKNRIFALRMLEQLQHRHAWSGWLVFAGPRVPYGSSTPEEGRLLDERPRLREVVLDLGEVSEDEKEWLLQRAGAVVYPTVYEGFGLVPFEAADHDVPCLWAAGTSLSEILPDSAAEIVQWDAAASADRALALLRDPRPRSRNVTVVSEAGARLTWDAAAERLIELYEATCREPPAPAGVGERVGGLMRGELSEDAVRLVGPYGALPPELERPLLALATHPRLGAPVFGALKAGYRASHRLRKRRLNGAR